MKAKLVLFLVAAIFSLVVAELGLRSFMPGLGADVFAPDIPRESPFLYEERIGFEIKPFAFIESHDEKGALCLEQMNSEGFRGPEYAIPKPKGVFRILLLGDSIVQSCTVAYKQSWGQLLEEGLNQYSTLLNSSTRYEVINAAIGGYVSRQALALLEDKGLKYQPDLVLVLAGVNDLVFSALPNWTPLMNLTMINQARVGSSGAEPKKSRLWSCLRMPLYRYSYIARLLRRVRNNIWNSWRIYKLIKNRQKDSGVIFNQRALEGYIKNLEKTYHTLKTNGAQMGLITWPYLLEAGLLHDADIHRRLVLLYSIVPLSTRELWIWNKRYVAAQQQFVSAHPDILFIDAQAAFAGKNKDERLSLFVDLEHLTVEGNRLLGEVILNKLKDTIVKQK